MPLLCLQDGLDLFHLLDVEGADGQLAALLLHPPQNPSEINTFSQRVTRMASCVGSSSRPPWEARRPFREARV
jgi:hypothetical protein